MGQPTYCSCCKCQTLQHFDVSTLTTMLFHSFRLQQLQLQHGTLLFRALAYLYKQTVFIRNQRLIILPPTPNAIYTFNHKSDVITSSTPQGGTSVLQNVLPKSITGSSED